MRRRVPLHTREIMFGDHLRPLQPHFLLIFDPTTHVKVAPLRRFAPPKAGFPRSWQENPLHFPPDTRGRSAGGRRRPDRGRSARSHTQVAYRADTPPFDCDGGAAHRPVRAFGFLCHRWGSRSVISNRDGGGGRLFVRTQTYDIPCDPRQPARWLLAQAKAIQRSTQKQLGLQEVHPDDELEVLFNRSTRQGARRFGLPLYIGAGWILTRLYVIQ